MPVRRRQRLGEHGNFVRAHKDHHVFAQTLQGERVKEKALPEIRRGLFCIQPMQEKSVRSPRALASQVDDEWVFITVVAGDADGGGASAGGRWLEGDRKGG